MSRRLVACISTGALALGMMATSVSATAAPDAQKRKPYVVIMEAEPALSYTGGTKRLAATKPDDGEKINAKDAKVKAYVSHLKSDQQAALKEAGVSAKPVNQVAIAANGFAAMMTPAEAEKVSKSKGVAYVEEDELRQVQTDVSPEFLGLTKRSEAWGRGLTGKGVIVGVIDTGIWPEHPSFRDPGGLARPTGPAAKVPCEFGDTAHNPADKPFKCQNKLIGARDMRTLYKANEGPEVYNSARDYDGHGTHTASTAAGNRNVKASIFGIDRGRVSGIAPQAGIIAYSALGDKGGYGSDLGAAIDQAVADGVDVINYSVGSSTPRLGLDGIAFLRASDAGVWVATSNGNAGPRPTTTGSPAFLPWVTSVGASTTPRTFENKITLGNGKTFIGTSITEGLKSTKLIDGAARGNPKCLPDVGFTPALKGEIVVCDRGDTARVDKSRVVKDEGGAGVILVNNDDVQALITDSHYLPASHVRRSQGQEIRAYITSAGDKATASLSAGQKARQKASVMADFSSRGPVGSPGVADIIRPDVTAPGVNILAGNTPTPGSGRPGQLFQSISGTSMSSPHVAGLFALLKQARPDLSASAAKSAVMTTARQDVFKEDGKRRADPFDMGAGHVNPGRPQQKGSMFDPGLAYEASTADYLAFLCGSIPGVVAAKSCEDLQADGYSTEAAQLNLPSIGVSEVPGVRTIERTVTNVSTKRLRASAVVQSPTGFKTKVSPSRVDLRPGQSKTFKITFTTTTATPGQWSYGALTWRGQGYKVRSPIAVQATAIGAPEQVSVKGPYGSSSFDVTFGYTGPYSVDAHGLANDKPIDGTVEQARNTTFDPKNVGDGITVHEVTLTDVASFRLDLKDSEISAPSTDLDLYMYDSSGKQVATSASGGSDESIVLDAPASGTYKVYVHGWSVGPNPVDYKLHTWAISSRPNYGSLRVTSAPTSATSGTTGTIKFSWSDVPSGTTAYGLLVHRDGKGRIGTTVVEAKN